MTAQRWRQISDLFDAALRLEPAERGDWLRGACGQDDELRTEVDRLLVADEEASRSGFLIPPDLTASWHPRDNGPPTEKLGAARPAQTEPAGDEHDFPQTAAIAASGGSQTSAEARRILQSRLRELSIIYLLIFGMAFLWRLVVRGRYDLVITGLHVAVLVGIGTVTYLLRGKATYSISRLRALELALIGMAAARVAFAQYWLMLGHSLRYDPMAAQRTMQNHVLLFTILILTSGIYVPKSWWRAALLGVPLALLPTATLLVLHWLHPDITGWLTQRRPSGGSAPMTQYIYDTFLLLILAGGAAWGADTMSGLRKQVVEARQLGQYRLRKRLGSGGMGEVYLADHQLLKRPCAVKLIRPGDAADPKALERFEREVRITATLSCWNTVEIYDYGRTEDGTYYYVMEYLPGLSLAELVERHGPLPPGRVIFLLRQVCLALREAHAAGLIHRDIKPSNIFAARRGGLDDVAKLLDFGLVLTMIKGDGPDLYREAQILGTPLFMSPEQALGGLVMDERSDIYSLGTVAYFLLTGRPPFERRGGLEAMLAHARDPLVPPSRLQADVPEDLERVVLRCLAKHPAERYQDADSLRRALDECASAGDWNSERAARWWRETVPDGAPG